MDQEQLFRDILALPDAAQEEVRAFVAAVRARYAGASSDTTTPRTNLDSEPFVGMWKEREDLKDSTDWVRKLREREWGSRGAGADDS